MGPVAQRDFYGFDRQILSPTFAVELGDHTRDTFVVEKEREAKKLAVPITE